MDDDYENAHFLGIFTALLGRTVLYLSPFLLGIWRKNLTHSPQDFGTFVFFGFAKFGRLVVIPCKVFSFFCRI